MFELCQIVEAVDLTGVLMGCYYFVPYFGGGT
jgi:hypothetical protein